MLTTLLLTTALLAPPADTAVDPDEPLLVVHHDLRGVGIDVTHAHTHLPLLPVLRSEEEPHEESIDTELQDWLESLFLDELFEEELMYEGRLIAVSDQRLTLVAPEAVQEGVRRVVDHVRAVCQRSATLRLEGYALVPGRSLPQHLQASALPGLVESGVLKRLPVRRERLRLGQPLLREQLLHHDLLRGWEAEIANSAVALTPVVERVRTGSRTVLWAQAGAPGSGRCRVGVADLGSTLLDVERRSLDLQDELTLDAATWDVTGERRLDLHRIATSDLVGEGLLAPGEDLLLAAMGRSLGGSSGGLLRVVLESLDPEPAPVQAAGRSLQLMDLSHLWPAGQELPAIRSGQLRGEHGQELSDQGYVSWMVPELGLDFEFDDWSQVTYDTLDQFSWADGHSVQTLRQWALVSAPSAEALEQLRRDLLPWDGGATTTTLHWRLEREDGEALVAGLLPLLDGDALAVVGEGRSCLRGLEVDVATSAVCQQPELMDVFDGSWLRVRRHGPRELQLSLASSRLVDWDRSSAGRRLDGMLDRLTLASTDVQASLPIDGAEHELVRLADGLRLVGRVTVGSP